MFGKDANRGVFNLRSHVKTAGKLVSSFSIPSSISLDMSNLLSSIFSSEIKHPCGQFIKADKI